MATYEIQTEDGATYQIETEDDLTFESPQKGFAEELAGGKGNAFGNAIQWGTDIVSAPIKAAGGLLSSGATGLKTAAQSIWDNPSVLSNPGGAIAVGLGAAGSQLYQGVDTPLQAIDRTGELASSAIPGGRTAYDYLAGQVGLRDEKAPGEYGKELREDLSFLPTMGALYGAGRYSANRAARRVAEKAAFEDPSSQAALRYAQNRGLLNTDTAQKAITDQKVTPELERAATVAQKESLAMDQQQYGKDYLPGVSLGMPESSSSMRPFAASETMAEAGPTLIESGLYSGGERINPFTGKFEGAPSAPLNAAALANKMEMASVDLVSARKGTVVALDQAMQDINGAIADPAQRIQPITFDADVAPALDGLNELVNKRSMLAQTNPMSEAMQIAYDKVRESFNSVRQNMARDPSMPRRSLTVSETLSMVENMNAFRRAVGEFDEAARAQGLNSTFSDFTGRGAELNALKQIQTAVQSALESKSSEILSKMSVVKEPRDWMISLSPVTESSIATMNKTYGAFQDAIEAARTYSNTTNRGMVTAEPGRLISSVNQTQQNPFQQAMDPKRTFLQKAGDALFPGKPRNPALEAAERNSARPAAAVSQVLDALLLREKPVPILSRSWENIKASPEAMNELAMRAVQMGLIPMGIFNSLSDIMKRQVHKAVIAAAPQAAERAPGGLSVIDNKLQDPLEVDALKREAIDKSPAERAMDMQALFKSEVPPSIQSGPVFQNQESGLPDIDLTRLSQSMESALTVPEFGIDNSYDKGASSMVEELERATSRHAAYEVH